MITDVPRAITNSPAVTPRESTSLRPSGYPANPRFSRRPLRGGVTGADANHGLPPMATNVGPSGAAESAPPQMCERCPCLSRLTLQAGNVRLEGTCTPLIKRLHRRTRLSLHESDVAGPLDAVALPLDGPPHLPPLAESALIVISSAWNRMVRTALKPNRVPPTFKTIAIDLTRSAAGGSGWC